MLKTTPSLLISLLVCACDDGSAGLTPDTSTPDTSTPETSPETSPPDTRPPDASPGCESPTLVMQLGTEHDDEVTALLGDDQRLWIGGYEGGITGVEQVDPAGRARGIVRALDHEGATLVRHEVDSGVTDAIEALAFDGDDVVVLGRTKGALVGASHGDWDAFIAVIADDVLTPKLQAGSERPQHPRTLARTDSGWIIGGFDDLWVPTNYVEAWSNPAFGFADAGLSSMTLTAWDTPPDDVSWGSAPAPDGLFMAWQRPTGDAKGAHVARLDQDGATLWDQRLSPIGFDGIGALQLVGDVLVVAGTTYVTLGDAAYGEQDAFVAWLDPTDGRVLDVVQLGGTHSEWVTALVVAADGRVHIAGETLGSIDGIVEHAGGAADVFVATIAPDRSVERVWQRGTSGDDRATALAIGPCGRLYVAGGTDGAFSARSHGGRDGFVLEVR